MQLEISDECNSKINNLIFQLSMVCRLPNYIGAGMLLRPDQGIAIFAVDDGLSSTAAMYTVELPTNLEDAKGMLDCWNDQPVGDAVKKARDLAQSNEAVIRTAFDYIALSCWLVAWSYEHGMSLEEQVQMADDYAHLFAAKGKHYTFSRTNLGPRIPAAGIEP